MSSGAKDTKSWKSTLRRQLRLLKPRQSLPRTYQKCHDWWVEHSVQNLLGSTKDRDDLERLAVHDPTVRETSKVQRASIRRRIWDICVQSCIKLDSTEVIANQVFQQFSQTHRGDERLINSLCVVVLGSVSRMEAELSSDVDLDILFDSPPMFEAHDQNLLHNDFKREMCRKAEERLGTEGINALIKDVRVYGYSQIEKELDTGEYDHISKLLLEGTFLIKSPTMSKKLNSWRKKATCEGMKNERVKWLNQRFEQLTTDIKRGEAYPHSSRYHMLVSFFCQVMALSQGEPEVARQPYWQAADILIGALRSKEEVGEMLRKAVIKTIKVRESGMMRSDDIFELYTDLLVLEQLTGIHVMGAPIVTSAQKAR